jgi:hypothetical protein
MKSKNSYENTVETVEKICAILDGNDLLFSLNVLALLITGSVYQACETEETAQDVIQGIFDGIKLNISLSFQGETQDNPKMTLQ